MYQRSHNSEIFKLYCKIKNIHSFIHSFILHIFNFYAKSVSLVLWEMYKVLFNRSWQGHVYSKYVCYYLEVFVTLSLKVGGTWLNFWRAITTTFWNNSQYHLTTFSSVLCEKRGKCPLPFSVFLFACFVFGWLNQIYMR